jgi:hypothetical protein
MVSPPTDSVLAKANILTPSLFDTSLDMRVFGFVFVTARDVP